jgi:hypothetical protein
MLIAGWALATVLVLVLGLQSVSAISDSVTSHPKPSLSPGSVKAALDRSSSSEPSSSSSSGASASLSDASSVSSVSDDHGGAQATSSNGPASSGDENASNSAGSSATALREDRRYQLVGGSVGVRFENGAAHLLWATPNSGFSVDSRGGSTNVDVRFRSDSHESRLKAFWGDNGPEQEIEEQDR